MSELKQSWRDESPEMQQVRNEFERQHNGRDLRRHNMRGTYQSATIAALWNQHLRTIEWLRRTQPEATKPAQELGAAIGDTGNAEADRLINRLMSSDPDFDDCADAAAFIRRMVIENKGPDGFATWKDAAVAERMKRTSGDNCCSHGIHYDNACGACIPPRGTTVYASPADALVAGDREPTDTEMLDFVTREKVTIYLETERRKVPLTDGSFDYRYENVPVGWTLGVTSDTFETPRAAIRAAIQAQKDGHG